MMPWFKFPFQSRYKYCPVHKTSGCRVGVSQQSFDRTTPKMFWDQHDCQNVYQYHCINDAHIFFSWHIWWPEIVLVSVMILVSDGCYCCQSWSGEAWGVSWLSSPRTPLRRRSGSPLLLQPWWPREWRRVLRLRLTPCMTWAILSRSCEREITSGLLKWSVKNYSIRRAQRLWLCWHACNSSNRHKFCCLGSL